MNCNVTIESQDLQLGQNIAREIRATAKGGLPGVQSMAFHHEGNMEIACNVEAMYLSEKDYASHPLKGELTCSFGHCYYVPAHIIQSRVAALAAAKLVKTSHETLVGFSPEEAQKVAVHALSTGQGEYYKSRTSPMM